MLEYLHGDILVLEFLRTNREMSIFQVATMILLASLGGMPCQGFYQDHYGRRRYGRQWDPYYNYEAWDTFMTVGRYIDSFEIVLNYAERRFLWEMKKNSISKRSALGDFDIRGKYATIRRGFYSSSNIKPYKQSIRLRDRILRRKVRLATSRFSIS